MAELAHELYGGEQAGVRGVAPREEAAVGVHRETPADAGRLALDERAALALGAEAGVLELDDDVDREVVGDPGDVDVVTRDTGDAERRLGREAAALEAGETRCRAGIEVAVPLAPAEHGDGGVAPERGDVGCAGHDDAARPLVHETAVEQLERFRDHARRHDLVDGQLAAPAVHRQRVEGCAVALGDGDLGQLLLGGAELVHVPPCDHRVVGDAVPHTYSYGLPSCAMCATARSRSAPSYPSTRPAATVGIMTTDAIPCAMASAARPRPADWLDAPMFVAAWKRSG